MKQMMIGAAIAVLVATPALAADLGRPVYKSAPPLPPPAPVYNWTGCYVNGGAGYGLWNIDHFGEVSGTTVTSTTTSGGRGWLAGGGGGCDYQFGAGTGFWSNWVVGAFADADWMDLHRNFEGSFGAFNGDEKESSAWAVGARIGYLVTPNILTYWNGGYTQSHFDQINFSSSFGGSPFTFIDSNTYHGWFIGGGTEIALSGLFGLPLPGGLFWRSEYRYSSFNSTTCPSFSLTAHRSASPKTCTLMCRRSPPRWSIGSTGWDISLVDSPTHLGRRTDAFSLSAPMHSP
jgi:outer membrane immunogenic protein